MTLVEAGLPSGLALALDDELPAAAELRHRLHADPRPSGNEADTAALVVTALDAGDGVAVAGTGRIVPLGTGPCVALRAELDALPIVERSGVAWSADGAYMHACGHDVHLAAVVAACRAIGRFGGPHPVAAVLQPREEGAPSGARDVVASGVLDRLGVRAVIGAHVQPRVDAGAVAVTPGLVNASVDEFEIEIRGRGGHAGYPHTVADPVLALASAVVALQQLPARRVDPVAGAVCMVTEITAGSAANVVPELARARGTLRLMQDGDRSAVGATLVDVVQHVAAAHGCVAEVRMLEGEPALANDPILAAGAAAVLAAEGYPVVSDFRSFGADDFAYYCGRVPSLMVFVGVDGVGLHDPSFVPADETIRSVAHALLAGYLAACASLE